MKKQRIWEIDAFRGLCILFVFAAHLVYDLGEFANLALHLGPLELLFHYGGFIFVVISGISATLGSRSFRRGLIVLGCGMGITLVTGAMIALGMLSASARIEFGVLHLLGVCMIVYPWLKKLPTPVLAIFGVVSVALGFWFDGFYLTPAASGFDWQRLLFVFGLRLPDFAAGDYFPLFPNLGWFILGVVLGRILYKEKKTRFPRVRADAAPLRLLRFAGRHSLELYLVHQPVIYGVLQLVLWMK